LRQNTAPDAAFYKHPRLLPAVTPPYAERLTALYARHLAGGERILDVGASWDSYLPRAAAPAYVEGLGMNAVELGRNAALDAWAVLDLNAAPGAAGAPARAGTGGAGPDGDAAAPASAPPATAGWPPGEVAALPYLPGYFDALLCNATVAYLTRPEGVMAEFGRLLRPGGVAIVAWSDALFYDKALAGWLSADPAGRLALVRHYLTAGAGLEVVEEVAVSAPREAAVTHRQLQRLGREAALEEPFYAIVARKPGGGEDGGEGDMGR